MKEEKVKKRKMEPLSNKHDITLKEFLQRKNRIEAELHQIQNDLDSSVHKVKDTFLAFVIPADKIRSKPLKSVGLAVLIGFVAGLPKARAKRSRNNGSPGFQKPGISGLMFDELKRIAARKAVQYFMDFVDNNISDRTNKNKQNVEEK